MNSSTRTDSHETISSSRAARWVAARWPTALGIIFLSGLFAFGFPAGTESWFVVFLSALVYLGAAALDQRRSAWAIFIVGLVGVVALQAFDLSLGPALIAAAVILFLTGALRGLMRPGARFTAQVLTVLAFGAVPIIALYVDPTIGAYLVAAGLLGHALWDAEHYRRDAVVARPYAEFCGVLDLLLAAVVVVVLVA